MLLTPSAILSAASALNLLLHLLLLLLLLRPRIIQVFSFTFVFSFLFMSLFSNFETRLVYVENDVFNFNPGIIFPRFPGESSPLHSSRVYRPLEEKL